MKKKILAALTAGILSMGLMTGNVLAADTEEKGDKDLKGEVYAFIAASLSNSMEEIQKDFNELYPNVTIYYRLKKVHAVIFSFRQQISR